MMTIILEISTEDSLGDRGLSISPGGQLSFLTKDLSEYSWVTSGGLGLV